MEIDWQNVTFEYDAEANRFTNFDLDEQNFSNHQSFQQPQQNIQVESVKRSRKEMEEEIFIDEIPETNFTNFELDEQNFSSHQNFQEQNQDIEIQTIKKSKTEIEEDINQVQLKSEKNWFEDVFVFNTDDLIEEDIFLDDEDVKVPAKRFINSIKQFSKLPVQYSKIPQKESQIPQQFSSIPQQNSGMMNESFSDMIEEEMFEDDEAPQQYSQISQQNSNFLQENSGTVLKSGSDLIEEEIFEVIEVPQQYSQIPQQNSQMVLKSESGDAIYVCTTCTLDFPSIAYLKRHQNTKKHQRALKMEQRGRKVNQKRKYVRKNEVKPLENFQVKHEVRTIADHFQVQQEVVPRTENIQNRTANFQPNQDVNSITDLTPEEIELLHLIDNQIMKVETEKSAKDFYENFKFDVDEENEEPAKVQKISTVKEIMENLNTRSGPSKNILLPRTIAEEAKHFVNLPVMVQPIRQPLVLVPQNRQDIVQVPQNRQDIVQVPQNRQQIVQVPQIRQQFVQVPQNGQFFQVQQPTVQFQAQRVPVNTNEEQPKTKIQCQMCPKTFNLRCHYTQHMNIVHTGDRNFKCQKCGKKYPQQELLDIHMEKHTGIKPFKCSKCVKSYNNKVDLKRHEKTHSEIKDHICKICGGGFVRYDHLEKHLAIHLKNKGLRLGDKIRSRKGLPIKNEVVEG